MTEHLRYYQQKVFFSLILKESELLNNPISRKIKEAIIERIEQRRNSNLVGMLHYLNSGKNYKRQDDSGNLPVIPNKTVLILLSKKMLSRLSCTSTDETESS